jgi:hypothetical protein
VKNLGGSLRMTRVKDDAFCPTGVSTHASAIVFHESRLRHFEVFRPCFEFLGGIGPLAQHFTDDFCYHKAENGTYRVLKDFSDSYRSLRAYMMWQGSCQSSFYELGL